MVSYRRIYVQRLELGLVGCLSFSFYYNEEKANKPLFLAFELISFDLYFYFFPPWLFGWSRHKFSLPLFFPYGAKVI